MKDKLIFIISIVLVILGIGYLGLTSYKFFTRQKTQTPTNTQQTTKTTDISLSLESSSNQEIIAENLGENEVVSIKATVKNNEDSRISTALEGRVYEVSDIFTFPTIDSDLPDDAKELPVTLNAGEASTYTYDYTTQDCGDYYMALAQKEYWTEGTGVVTYGYFSVNCTDTGLTPANITRQKSPIEKGTVAGTTTTKGGISTATQLPKAGSENILAAIGLFLTGIGGVVREKIGKRIK